MGEAPFDGYCRIYVQWSRTDAGAGPDPFRRLMRDASGGEIVQFDVQSATLWISPRTNDASDPAAARAGDFIAFPFTAEIDAPEFRPPPDPGAHIRAVANLVLQLSERGAEVVVSCAFEDELAALTGGLSSPSRARPPA